MSEHSDRDLLVRIDTRTEATAKDVALLKRIVIEGNGQPPLTSQFATLRERSKNQGRQLAALWGVVLGLIGGINFK